MVTTSARNWGREKSGGCCEGGEREEMSVEVRKLAWGKGGRLVWRASGSRSHQKPSDGQKNLQNRRRVKEARLKKGNEFR